MNFDVVIVGAGPSGLSMAIRLAQLAQEKERELTICILEKGSDVSERDGVSVFIRRCGVRLFFSTKIGADHLDDDA